jgi:hypothetical protein
MEVMFTVVIAVTVRLCNLWLIMSFSQIGD